MSWSRSCRYLKLWLRSLLTSCLNDETSVILSCILQKIRLLCRKAYRVGKWIQNVNALRKQNIKHQLDYLELLANIGEGVYYFLEQLTWWSLQPSTKTVLFQRSWTRSWQRSVHLISNPLPYALTEKSEGTAAIFLDTGCVICRLVKAGLVSKSYAPRLASYSAWAEVRLAVWIFDSIIVRIFWSCESQIYRGGLLSLGPC